MGQVISKIVSQMFSKTLHKQTKSPYDLFDADELTSLQDLKKKYNKLFYQNQRNTNKLVEINTEYKKIQESVDVDLYLQLFKHAQVYEQTNLNQKINFNKQTNVNQKISLNQKINFNDKNKKNYAETKNISAVQVVRDKNTLQILYKEKEHVIEHNKLVLEFFEKIAVAYEIKCTPAELNSGFYRFWSKFKSNDQVLENKIRKIVQIVRKEEKRTEEKHRKEKKEEKKKQKQKNKKQYKIMCLSCQKGFNNQSTLNDHLKSKQHKESGGTEKDVVFNEERKVEE